MRLRVILDVRVLRALNVQVRRVAAVLERYRADCGDYPIELRGLVLDEGVYGWTALT